MKTSTAIGVLGLLVLFLLAGWWVYGSKKTSPTPPPTKDIVAQPQTVVAFACNDGKSIGAAFYQGSVALTLSDNRAQTLPQVEAASGIRYANADGSFVFWSKGNTAFITEGIDQKQTFIGCIVVAPDPTNTLLQVFASSTLGITIRFPQNYTVDQKYQYQGLGKGISIPGVKMTVPAAATTGTNLSKDTYLSVETALKPGFCTADRFLDLSGNPKGTAKPIAFTDGGVAYSVATTTGAAAGNIYEEAVFAIANSSPCTAVRYFIHSSNIGNYTTGTVKEFDKVGVINEFDAIRRTLIFGR